MGEPIRTRKGKLVERGKHDTRLGHVVQVKKGRRKSASQKGGEEIHSFELTGEEIFLNYDETKSKVEKNQKNGSNKEVHRGQSIRYRSGWKTKATFKWQ